MQKITSIHLNGKAYQIEDAGYEALRGYLARAEAQLKDNPDKDEIIGDLEQAIGEKCRAFLNASKDVVTSDEITRIIEDMGPVDGPEKDAKHASATSSTDASAPKRLYLIREGAWIGGVCTGLAAYFNWDVNIVRIAFIALTLLSGGAWILLYLALMFLVPYAGTSEERAEAHGVPFNAQQVINRSKEAYSRVADRHEWHQWKQEARKARMEWHKQKAEWNRQRHEMRHRYWHGYPADGQAMYRPSPFFGLLSALLAVVWIASLLSLITTGAIFGWAVTSTMPLWLAIVLLFIVYHAVTGPLRAAKWHANQYYDGWTAVSDGIGTLFIFVAIWFAYTHVPEFQGFINTIGEHIRAVFQG
jgi:phage shock protein PspC (stress-responsive transcriptional regulator)